MLMFIFNDEDSGKRRKQLFLDNGLTIPRGLQKKCFKKKCTNYSRSTDRKLWKHSYLTRGKYC